MSDLPPPGPPEPTTAIRATTKTHPVGVLLRAMKPRITVDGVGDKPWGTSVHDVTAGGCEVAVSLPYANVARKIPRR